MIFKVIGDVHADGYYLGYVKYHPDTRGDRRLFGQTYRQNTVVSKSFGILADRPECYVYSPVLGCVITGLPRHDVTAHYSCRQALSAIHDDPQRVQMARAGGDLLTIIARIVEAGARERFGVTGSFLVGCFNARSDIDLVCYGPDGYAAAKELFADPELIRPYAGDELTQLYLRRAKYMAGGGFDTLVKQEQRKLQGLAAHSGAHVTDHAEGLATPALYRITARVVLHSTIDEPDQFAPRITMPAFLPRRLHRGVPHRGHRVPVRQARPPPRRRPRRLRHRADSLERQQVLPGQPDRVDQDARLVAIHKVSRLPVTTTGRWSDQLVGPESLVELDDRRAVLPGLHLGAHGGDLAEQPGRAVLDGEVGYLFEGSRGARWRECV